MVNVGKLERHEGAGFSDPTSWLTTWYGKQWPKDQAVEAGGSWWATYTEEQLEACGMLVEILVHELFGRDIEVREVLGHRHIAPGRKKDPGDAFPLATMRVVAERQLSAARRRHHAEIAPTPDSQDTGPADALSEAYSASQGDSRLPRGAQAPVAAPQGLRGWLQRLLLALAGWLGGQDPRQAPESAVADQEPGHVAEDGDDVAF